MDKALRNCITDIMRKSRDSMEEYYRTTPESHINDTLCGYCAIGAAVLFNDLIKNGFSDVQFAINNHHAFVKFQGNTILDITACQFKLPDIYISSKYNGNSYYSHPNLFSDLISAREHQISSGWPECQIIPHAVANGGSLWYDSKNRIETFGWC